MHMSFCIPVLSFSCVLHVACIYIGPFLMHTCQTCQPSRIFPETNVQSRIPDFGCKLPDWRSLRRLEQRRNYLAENQSQTPPRTGKGCGLCLGTLAIASQTWVRSIVRGSLVSCSAVITQAREILATLNQCV